MKCAHHTRRRRDGYATVAVLTIIVLMTALTALNLDVAVRLHRRVHRLDQRQQERWQKAAPPPAMPTVRQPMIFAICPTQDPTAPAAVA